jgi:Ca2+-binding RTX toxin-like protein
VERKNDIIFGGNHRDTLNGDAGIDRIFGGDFQDVVHGGADGDVIFGDSGADDLFGDAGDDVIVGGVNADLLDGGTENDELFGEHGADIMRGGSGSDILVGGEHGDDMTGGRAGRDIFRYFAVTDSQNARDGLDLIRDFERGLDTIDLSRIDAAAGGTGNDAFEFVGTAGFDSSNPGQVRAFFDAANNQTVIQAKTNSDSAAEMEIRLSGNVQLDATDFVL